MTKVNKVELLINGLKSCTGGWSDFISTKDVAAYFGYSTPQPARKYTYGLKKYGNKYFIPDVAEQIIEMGVYKD